MVPKRTQNRLHESRLRGVAVALVLSIGLSVPVDAYDADAACDYARRYYNKVCSDGYFYRETYPPSYLGAGTPVPTDVYGHDCAHFVSCCIGSESHDPGGGLPVLTRVVEYGDYGEPAAKRLINWLVQEGAELRTSISQLSAGDVIGYDTDGDGTTDHVALYLGSGLAAAHSQRWMGRWQLTYSSGFEYVHIPASLGPTGGDHVVKTATVLVMDTSGSMGYKWQGGVKIESAKEAALQFIYHVEQENLTQGTEHWIGVVGFSNDAHLILPLTNNYAKARSAVISLHATNATNLGAGLVMGLEQVSGLGGEVQRYVTILSDGNTNTGLSKEQILSGPVVQARSAGICLNTVAFGDKNDVDEAFLRRIASTLLGCGRYEYAATGFDLFAAYIKIRHHALGQVISGLSSFGRSVTPLVGRSIPLGTISIPSGQRELQITLGWSELGTLQLKLYDPSGRQVTSSYPGARLYSSAQFAQAIVTSPHTGIWRVEALPATSMPNGTQYFAIGSTRPGGIAFALPLPVLTVGDRTFSLPGNMPTWALVLISVVCIAIGLWQLLQQ